MNSENKENSKSDEERDVMLSDEAYKASDYANCKNYRFCFFPLT